MKKDLAFLIIVIAVAGDAKPTVKLPFGVTGPSTKNILFLTTTGVLYVVPPEFA